MRYARPQREFIADKSRHVQFLFVRGRFSDTKQSVRTALVTDLGNVRSGACQKHRHPRHLRREYEITWRIHHFDGRLNTFLVYTVLVRARIVKIVRGPTLCEMMCYLSGSRLMPVAGGQYGENIWRFVGEYKGHVFLSPR